MDKLWFWYIILTPLVLIVWYLLRKKLEKERESYTTFFVVITLLVTSFLTVLTITNQNAQFQTQFQLQNQQYLDDNRPQVFFLYTNFTDEHTVTIPLFNSGKLPARIEHSYFTIFVNRTFYKLLDVSPDNRFVLFPNQAFFNNFFYINKTIYPAIKSDKGFYINITTYYYSITDIQKKNLFYYTAIYYFPLNVSNADNNLEGSIALDMPYLYSNYAQ